MGRLVLATLPPACLVAFAMLAGAACDSSLNLGNAEGDGGAPDSAPPTCEGACDRLITTCGLATTDRRAACVAACNQRGKLSDLVCIAQSACSDILQRCGTGAGPVDASVNRPDTAVLDDFEIRNCQSSCDSSQFFSCITASELSTCRGLCATSPAPKRNAYQACASGAGGNCAKDHDCFDVFAGD